MNGMTWAPRRGLLVLGAALSFVCAAGTVKFTEEPGVIRNPGQGWSTMGGKWSFDQSDPVVNVGAVYCRFSWTSLEPEEGRYNWKPLDELLAFAASKGLPASFRIMCASQHSNTGWPTPPWVFKKGAKDEPFLVPKVRRGVQTNVVHHTPVFDDPVFMAAHKRFVKALAARYDGDPRLAGLDLGSYGHWGEWHCGGLPPDTNRYVAAEARAKLKWVPPRKYPFEIRKQYADWYLESFKKTPIVFMTDDWEVLRYALGDGPWFEFFGSGKSILEKGWDLPYAVEWMLTNHVTVVNTCPFSPWEMKDSPYYPLLKKLDLYAGARLVPQEATVQRSGRRVTVSLSGVNKGVARIHLPYVLQIVARDRAGRELLVHAATADPGSWLPGPFRFSETFSLPHSAGADVSFAIRLRHRHGIFRDFRFAARETASDGTLPLLPVSGHILAGIEPEI